MNFFNIIKSLFLKVFLLLFLHVLFYFITWGPYYAISHQWGTQIELTEAQVNSTFNYVPNNIDSFQHFQEATNGLWLKPIEKKDGILIIDFVAQNAVHIESNSELNVIEHWKINGTELNKLTPSNSIVTKRSYLLRHIWGLALLLLCFFIVSWLVDKVVKLRTTIIEIALSFLYCGYVYSVLF